MKKIIFLAAAVSAIGLAAPAAAQDRYGNYNQSGYANGYGGVDARTDQLQRRVQVGIQRGTISRQEAVYLRDGLRQLTRLERQYSRDGLNRNERRTLQNHILQLQRQIQVAERSRETRYERDGRDWNDGRDRDDRYDDRYDDRNDRDERWDDRRDRD